MIHKKISSDVLHLALLLAIVRLGPEILRRNEWHQPIFAGDVYLGSTLAHRQYYSHIDYQNSRYNYLKNIDPFVLHEITSVRYRSHFIDEDNAPRDSVIAYFSDPPSTSAFHDDSSHDDNSTSVDDADGAPLSDSSDYLPEQSGSVASVSSLELSPEDMDLIEILWKQDIDLGVSREAYNPYENHENLKAKEGAEVGEKEPPVEPEKSAVLEKDKTPELHNDTASINYVIDSETGEQIIQEPRKEESKSNLSVEQSYLSFEDFEEFANTLVSSDETLNPGFNLTEDFLDDGGGFLEDFSYLDADASEAQFDKLEGTAVENLSEHADFDTASEMYPSMEEYWQDISTTLPLSVMNQACLFPRPHREYLETSDDHSGTSTSSDIAIASIAPSNAFAGALLQNASLIQRDSDVSSNFTYLSHLFNPTSLGCAVASSIATLTNDTDPMPDVSPAMNGTFGLDLPNLLPANQTTQPSASETLLSDLLEEDLQLMDVAGAASHPEVDACRPFSLMRIFDQNGENGDSISSHGYHSDKDVKLEELAPSACSSSKSILYGTYKYPSSQSPATCGFSPIDASHNENHGMGMQISTLMDSYSRLQHNHTYHLPFTSGGNMPKPVTRDKDSDDANNDRDEEKAKALDLPMTICEIINLAIDEFNEKLTKFELTETQHSLIRDIRRRGKNKVAAQNCRKRKMDQISTLQQDLDLLHVERMQLESDRAELLHQRRNIRDKYSKLCELLLQSSATNPPMLSSAASLNHQSNNSSLPSSSHTSDPGPSMNFNHGVRAKRKVSKKD